MSSLHFAGVGVLGVLGSLGFAVCAAELEVDELDDPLEVDLASFVAVADFAAFDTEACAVCTVRRAIGRAGAGLGTVSAAIFGVACTAGAVVRFGVAALRRRTGGIGVAWGSFLWERCASWCFAGREAFGVPCDGAVCGASATAPPLGVDGEPAAVDRAHPDSTSAINAPAVTLTALLTRSLLSSSN